MHPNLVQGIAAEHRADLRREADAYRRGRIRPVPGRRRQAASERMAHSATAGATSTNSTLADRSAEEMLVLPDGTTETAGSSELCSAGR